MKAIILAAGRGSRMKNLTEENPKCLVEFHGKPLLEWQLNALYAAGIEEVAVVTGYKRELLASRGLKEFHNEHWDVTNMVSSLACAEMWLENGPCIISYSDIFYRPEAVSSLIKSSAALAITYDPGWLKLWTERFGDPLLDAETFCINSDNELLEIGNKPVSVSEVQGQYMGLLRFTPAGWAEVQRIRSGMESDECDQIHMTGTLQKIIERGSVAIEAIPYELAWGEVDSADDLDVYQETLMPDFD